MSNIKTISQRTGEFIDEGSEPGFVVNLDEAGAQDFIQRVKDKGAPTILGSDYAAAEHESPVVVTEPVKPEVPSAPAITVPPLTDADATKPKRK